MTPVRFLIVVLALAEGGYMLFDGLHALVSGAYFMPGGQLGPWARVVSAIGIPPASRLMQAAFVGFGLAYLACVGAYLARVPRAPTALAVVAVASLWYFPVGTLLSVLQLTWLAVERWNARLLPKPPLAH